MVKPLILLGKMGRLFECALDNNLRVRPPFALQERPTGVGRGVHLKVRLPTCWENGRFEFHPRRIN